jgi:hypothetical protein
MKTKFALLLCLATTTAAWAQVPGIITYQGRVTSNGTNFTGTGSFRFALFRPGPPLTSLWSHDNSSAGGSMPGTALSLPVADGLFTVVLGDTTVAGMLSAVPASVFTNQDVRLRIWFNDGVSGVAQLAPDQRISSAAYALMGANVPDGAITTAKLADGAVTGTKIAGATIATGNLAANSVNTTHIIDGQVQNGDLANNAVTTGKVLDGTLLGADLADGTVGSRELASSIALGATNDTGRLDVYRTGASTPAITLSGTGSQISTYGSDGLEQIRLWGPAYGELLLNNSLANNATAVRLTAQGSTGGLLDLRNTNGATRAVLEGENTGGLLTLYAADGGIGAVLYGNEGAGSGALSLRNTNGSPRFRAYGGPGSGSMDVFHSNGTLTFNVDANEGTEGAQLNMYQANGARTVQLDAEAGASGGGYLGLYEGDGTQTVTASANGNGALTLRQGDGSTGLWLGADNGTGGGGLSLYRDNGAFAGQFTIADDTRGDAFLGLAKGNGNWGITMRGQNASTGGGAIYLYDSAGAATIVIDSDSSNEGRIWTQVLTITGGADLSENFNVNAGADKLLPGMLVSIDPAKPGELLLSQQPYDPSVAGIISGAGGVKTGMLMGQTGSVADGKHPVALTGRVYCYVDADAGGAVKPGDMLTTSATPGHAMKVSDRERAFGTVIGKAMTALESGKGLVLVLVSLQ